VTSAGAYRDACAVFWRAFRRRYGRAVEFCGFVEWTTGEGPRSGGHRRLHSHWLVKGLPADVDPGDVQRWAASEWKALTGAWVVQFAELRHAGGVVGYLALHHEKMEQRPPEGWTGRRLRPSRGYFAEDGRTRREKARQWLQEHRWRVAGLTEGGMVAASLRPAPRLVGALTEGEKVHRGIVAVPGSRFGSTLRDIRAHDRRLLRTAAARASEDELDRLARVWRESMREEAVRKRRRRREAV
jgi:hypothetical protein